ncbi:MAG TPA: class I tRNA ligase family protein, partial [Chitinophagaceae bacterium]|nr:class I tRNA ligase family protein [Chitinophagaceae bacterium]
ENRLIKVRSEVEDLYSQFRLSEALKTIYTLIWDDFCSWYLEWMKPGQEEGISPFHYEKTIRFFEQLMQLLHPFMPFVTEEIYHQLVERKSGDDLCILQYSGIGKIDVSVLAQASLLQQVITSVRELRTKNNIKPKDPITLHIQTEDAQSFQTFNQILKKQINAENIDLVTESVPESLSLVIGKHSLYVTSQTPVDNSIQKNALLKELDYQRGFLTSVERKLGNERFIQNAKPEVIAVEQQKKADAEQKIKALEQSIAAL